MRIHFIETQKQKKKIKNEPKLLPVLPLDLAVYRTGRPGFIDMRAAVSLMMPVAEAIGELHASAQTLPGLRPDTIDIADRSLAVNSSALLYEGVIYPGYSAPEIYTGVTHGIRTDIYSFSALLYYVVTGAAPDNAFNRMKQHSALFTKELYEEILRSQSIYIPELKAEDDPFDPEIYDVQPLPVIPDDMIDKVFVAILERGMAIEASERFDDMNELIASLSPYNTKASIVYPVLMAVEEQDIHKNLIVEKHVPRQVKKKIPEAASSGARTTSIIEKMRNSSAGLLEKMTLTGAGGKRAKTGPGEGPGDTAGNQEYSVFIIEEALDSAATDKNKSSERNVKGRGSADEIRKTPASSFEPSLTDEAPQESVDNTGLSRSTEDTAVQQTESAARKEHEDALKALLDEISIKKEKGSRTSLDAERMSKVWPDEPRETFEKMAVEDKAIILDTPAFEEPAEDTAIVSADTSAEPSAEAMQKKPEIKPWRPIRLNLKREEPPEPTGKESPDEAAAEAAADMHVSPEAKVFQSYLHEVLDEEFKTEQTIQKRPFPGLETAIEETAPSIEEVLSLSEKLLDGSDAFSPEESPGADEGIDLSQKLDFEPPRESEHGLISAPEPAYIDAAEAAPVERTGEDENPPGFLPGETPDTSPESLEPEAALAGAEEEQPTGPEPEPEPELLELEIALAETLAQDVPGTEEEQPTGPATELEPELLELEIALTETLAQNVPGTEEEQPTGPAPEPEPELLELETEPADALTEQEPDPPVRINAFMQKALPGETDAESAYPTLLEEALESRHSPAVLKADDTDAHPNGMNSVKSEEPPPQTDSSEKPLKQSAPKKPINLVRLWEKLEKMREESEAEDDSAER